MLTAFEAQSGGSRALQAASVFLCVSVDSASLAPSPFPGSLLPPPHSFLTIVLL